MNKILLAHCDFQNQFMEKPCNKQMQNDHGEPWCIEHGTRRFVVRASDIKGVTDSLEAHNKAGNRWSKEEIGLLIELADDGMDIDMIADTLNRTSNAVYYKLWSLRK